MEHEFKVKLAALMADAEKGGVPTRDIVDHLTMVAAGEMILMGFAANSIDLYFKGMRQEIGRRMQADIRATDLRLN